MFPLGGVQLRGPSAAVSFQQSFIAIFIPSANPGVNAGAIHLQALGDLTGGLALDAEHDGLQSQGDAGCFIGLGSLAKGFEPLESA